MWAQVSGTDVLKTMTHPTDVVVDGVTHPKSIFNKWSADDLKNIGVYPYRENSVDNRYHYSGELTYTVDAAEVVGSYATTDRDVASLKADMITTSKQAAAGLLSKHDWMAIREMEGGEAMPADVKTYRAAVRTESNDKETEINALADLDAVKAYEATSYTEVRKVAEYDDDGAFTGWGSDTQSYTRHMNMTSYYVAVDPTADADPSLVSFTKD